MGGHHLTELGQHGADEDKLIYEATTFVAACYRSKVDYTPLSEAEVKNGKLKDHFYFEIEVIASIAPRCLCSNRALCSASINNRLSQTLFTMDGMQAKMAQHCIQSHFQLVSLLHRSPVCT